MNSLDTQKKSMNYVAITKDKEIQVQVSKVHYAKLYSW
jgi:hypothetical protein